VRRPAESINRLKPRNTLVDCTFEANLPPDGDAHMKISWLGLVLLVAPLVALLVAPVVAWPQDQAPIGVSGAYRVGPGDVVQITVFEVAELSQPAVVTQQGSIPLPLVGEVGVEGLTTSEIESKLTSLYSQDLLRNPQISVRVEEFRSQPVSILGAVREPGVYQLQGRRRLLDVLAIAGGLSPEVGETITISRLGVQHPGVRRPMSGEVDSPQSPPSVQLVHLLDAEDRLGRREELRVSVRGLLTGAAGTAVPPAIIEEYLDHLGVRPAKGTRLVDVTFESVDPALAASVVDTLAEEYIVHNLEAKWNATQKASTWLQQQLSTLQAALETSESELAGYAARHSILFVEERKDITTERLAQFESSLTAAEGERIREQSRAMLVEDSIAGGDELPGSFTSDMYQQLQATLSDLKREHSQLLVTFARGYPSVQRVERQIEQLAVALAAERKRILSSVTESYQLASRREELFRKAVLHQRALVNQLSGDFIQYDVLKREAETNRQLYEGLLQRLKEAGVSAGLRASNVAILDRAELPERPYRPRQLFNAALGLLGGLLLGAAAAFVQEHMTTLVRTPEEVERMTGLSLLAVIPRSRSKGSAKVITEPAGPVLPAAEQLALAPVSETEPGQSGTVNGSTKSTANGSLRNGLSAGAVEVNGGGEMCWRPEPVLSEAYRTLRSSVLLGLDDSMRRILVTSSQPQEGKTTVSLNLACSLAQLKRRVLVIDADMRRPNCTKQLNVESDCGLTDYLQGLAEIDQVVTKTRIGGLWLAAAGRSNAVASDLLYSPRLATLLREAGKRFDHVVIDSPPSLVLSDARTISRMVEGVIMVVSDSTESGALMRTKQTFDEAGVHFLGFVMNRVNLDSLDYGYYRDYGYCYPYSDKKSA
jgi:succinoglycan biosynthesis transport protein ExoP